MNPHKSVLSDQGRNFYCSADHSFQVCPFRPEAQGDIWRRSPADYSVTDANQSHGRHNQESSRRSSAKDSRPGADSSRCPELCFGLVLEPPESNLTHFELRTKSLRGNKSRYSTRDEVKHAHALDHSTLKSIACQSTLWLTTWFLTMENCSAR